MPVTDFETILSISLVNFRGFQKQLDIPLAPITFLVGPNSSGKSSIIAAISLLAQNSQALTQPYNSDLVWTGSLVDAGSFSDVVYRHKENLTLKISLRFASGVVNPPWLRSKRNFPIDLEVALRSGGTNSLGRVHHLRYTDVKSGETLCLNPRVSGGSIKVSIELLGVRREVTYKAAHSRYAGDISDLIRETVKKSKKQLAGKRAAWMRLQSIIDSWGLNFFFEQIQRVASGRGGPKRWYATGTSTAPHPLDRGRRFEDVNPTMLSTPQDSDYLRRRKKRAPVDIKEFLTALHIAKGINEKRLSPYHTAIDITDSTTNVKSNLIDVGYGASQILPVAMACRSWSPAPLLIEQPEIHLHPRAQGEVADLLLNTARDRQVFIETHSVHLINRARLRVAEGSLKPSDVVVIYVDRNRRGSHAKAITIAPSGEFERDWPEGFFEERYQETLALIDAKAKRKDS